MYPSSLGRFTLDHEVKGSNLAHIDKKEIERSRWKPRGDGKWKLVKERERES